MASIEKLVKAFEALNVIQTSYDRPDEAFVSTRFMKRETNLSKKDKSTNCNAIADIICSPSLRNIEDFHKFLGIAIETLLTCCDDSDSDVRMIANECLNRVINNLLESQFGRLQVELYKEIKKNGASRSLRVALSRFADLCHLTRPAKSRPYVQNLFPCLVRICARTEEEALQETLRVAMGKIMPVLGGFASDVDIVSLLSAFIPNLQCPLTSVRRTAAVSLVLICQYSRKPHVFYSWLLSNLLQTLYSDNCNETTPTTDYSSRDGILIGTFLCLQHLIPQLYELPSHIEYECLKSFGLNQKQKESIARDYDAITENMLQMYELLLFNLRCNTNHNVILNALEALLQLLKSPPKFLLPYLLDAKGMDKSRIGTLIRSSTPASPMMTTNKRRRLQSSGNNSMTCSAENLNVSSLNDDDLINLKGVTMLSNRSLEDLRSLSDISEQRDKESNCDLKERCGEVDEDTISEYNSLAINVESQSELQASKDDVESTEISSDTIPRMTPAKHSPSPNAQIMKLTYVDEETSLANETQLSPTNDSFDVSDNDEYDIGDIAEFDTPDIVSLEYCTRLLCSQFLLSSTPGKLIPDKNVKVLVKSLSLGCIAAIIRLHPRSFIIDIHLTSHSLKVESIQKAWNIILFANHSDPNLKSQVAIIIGHFIHQVLSFPISYNQFLLKNCSISAYPEAPTLEELLTIMTNIILDKNASSIAIKNGLVALKLCLKAALDSNDAIKLSVLALIEQIIPLKNNPYWLIKAELLEIFCELPYEVIHHIYDSQNSQLTGLSTKQKSFQTKILEEIFIPLLADEDFRARNCAAQTLSRVVPSLFTPSAHLGGDVVVALALESTIQNRLHLQSTDVPFPLKSHQLYIDNMPTIQDFIFPLKCKNNQPDLHQISISSNLASVLKLLTERLKLSYDNKNAVLGFLQALLLLSDKYPVTEFASAWGCEHDTNNANISTCLINVIISLLKTNPAIILDLNAHQHAINLVSNLLEGLSYYHLNNCKISPETDANFIEHPWGLLSRLCPLLVTQLEALFSHLLKVFHMCTNVLDESSSSSGGSSGSHTSSKPPLIQTLSGSTLSPMRKKPPKTSLDVTVGKTDADKVKLVKNDLDKPEREKPTKTPTHVFVSPLLAKLHDLLKATYSSCKTSTELKNDKIFSFIRTILSSLAKILEISTLKFIGKYIDELLVCLKVVITMESSGTVRTVRQMLKCIFGTNFAVLIANEKLDSNEGNKSEKHLRPIIKNSQTPNHKNYGLYHYCISAPYTSFSQLYASRSIGVTHSTATNEKDTSTIASFLRKKIERRVSSLLDKSFSPPNQNIPYNSKSALTSHIRSFEPIVIKSLKQYTITSDIELQCEVLDLLSQLVQLRVNYCLLDSDQIFINFVLKQFEFVEGNQITDFHLLITHVFYFLVLLSYEKYHSKPIIGVPKIIQLCDGILASNQQHDKYALPTFQFLVEDLFLHRNASKVESIRDLEAQREVVISNLLKMAQFPDILRILTLITCQSRKEGDEKWKKISRQIVDVILPLLIKQSVHLDDFDSFQILQTLFDSVSPSVFRPVDILLKAIFVSPQPDTLNNYIYFHRWISMILIVVRTLIVNAKEELVLTRLDDMKSSIITIGPFGLPVISLTNSDSELVPFHMLSLPNSSSDPIVVASEEMLAEYLLQIIQLCAHDIVNKTNSIYQDLRSHSTFMIQLMSNFMLILTHMFQSGSFRRVAKAAMKMVKAGSCENDLGTNEDLNVFSIEQTNLEFVSLSSTSPSLALQWFNILMLLNFEDNNQNRLWNKLMKPTSGLANQARSRSQSTNRRNSGSKSKQMIIPMSPKHELIKRGTLILLCDFVSENMSDAENMTWLIVQNINDMIKWSSELPIHEFINTIHRNPASSGLFIQAMNVKCEDNLMIPSFAKRLLKCIENVHATQTPALISFIIEKIISNPSFQSNYLLVKDAEQLALDRLKIMTNSDDDGFHQEVVNQVSIGDLEKLIESFDRSKFKNLNESLEEFKSYLISNSDQPLSPKLESGLQIERISDANKEGFLNILKLYCKTSYKDHKAAFLLSKLSHEDIACIFSMKEFKLSLLSNCIEMGELNLEEENKSPVNLMFSAVINRNILLKASLNAIIHHVNYFIKLLPTSHHPFLPYNEMNTPKEARHRDKIIDILNDSSLRAYLFSLSPGFISFLVHYRSQQSISSDLLKNIVRISVLYAEAAQYSIETYPSSSIINLTSVVKVMESTLKCKCVFSLFAEPMNISYQCSMIAAIYSITKHFFGELPQVKEPESLLDASQHENANWKHAHRACIRMCQLMQFVEQNNHDEASILPTINLLTRKVILLASRLPLVNSFVMIPPLIWNDTTWKPHFGGDYGTHVATVPPEIIKERDVLTQFSRRVTMVGWKGRVQFEEMWMSLLGVLGSFSNTHENSEDQLEDNLTSVIAVQTITDLLLQSNLSPQPGDPTTSTYQAQKQEKSPAFLHTRFGEKLNMLRQPLEHAIHKLFSRESHLENLEYKHGQVSIESLRLTISSNSNLIAEISPSISSGSSSTSSNHSPLSPVIPAISSSFKALPKKEKLEIDLNSCLHFLLDLYAQILTSQQPNQLPLVAEVARSTVLLSDLFTERLQFERLLETLNELHQIAQTSEDEIIFQHLIVGICKSSAVLGIDNDAHLDRIKKCVEMGLKSSFLPTRIATLIGLNYLFEYQGIFTNGKETAIFPLTFDYLSKHLGDDSLPSSNNFEHVSLMWDLSFHLIQYFVADFSENEFSQKIFQHSLKVLSKSKNPKLFSLVVNNLENLLISEKMTIKLANDLIKISYERFKSSDSQLIALSSLKLIVSSTYFVGSVGLDFSLGDKNVESNEDFLVAMEKLTVIFDRLKICHPFEATQICKILPHFLCEFFPTQDILNKCIGEFLSGQQTHAKHLASILFQLFNNLLDQSRHEIVHEWVLLSLSSFAQIIPLSNAIWALNSFLISASTNQWIKYTFPYLQTRHGMLETSDVELFCVVVKNFYNELKSDENRVAFQSTFQSLAKGSAESSPYALAFKHLQHKSQT